MKNIVMVASLSVISLFCPRLGNAQSNMYKNQRDSCVLLYNLAQIKLDSLGSKHLAVIQQLTELSSQINTLKNELAEIIKEKSEFNDILAKAKKLIADQIIMIEKLETEVKRLTPPKSKSQ